MSEPEPTPRDLLRPLRRIKHGLWLTRRRLKRAPDAARRHWAAHIEYRYDPSEHEQHVGDVVVPASSTFQIDHLRFPHVEHGPRGEAPRVVYAAWLGANELTAPRRTALQVMREVNAGLEIALITLENLDDVLVKGSPLHPAFSFLSPVHRSDYLCCYLMHHHGGAYADLKVMRQPWAPVLERLNSADHLWAAGPHEMSSRNTCPAMGPLGRQQRLYYTRTAFQAAFAFKPGSSWTEQWLCEVERGLDYFQGLLAQHPAQDPYGLEGDYPVPWSALMGHVFSPLALRYAHRFEPWPQMHFDYTGGGYR